MKSPARGPRLPDEYREPTEFGSRGKKGSPAQHEPVSWRGAGKKGGLGDGKQPRRPWWRTGDGHEQMKHTILLVLSFGIIVVLAVAWYRIWQGAHRHR